MAKVVIFDENATPQNVLEVKPFVSPQDYEGRTDIKMFGKGIDRTELTVLEGVHRKYWKHDNGSIVEMTQGEKDTVDATELATL